MSDQPPDNVSPDTVSPGTASPGTPPTAVVRSRIDRKRRLSLIWAIPIVTALVGAWLAWSTLSERGPLITISFQTAEGLTAGQSQIRHKDVVMGQVTKISLADDLQHVQVTVRMNREAQSLLTDKASFWVVKPRFFAGSITGLQTLVSGAYIEFAPVAGGGEPQRQFTGLEEAPVLQTDVPGRTFLLHAPRLGSLSLGSPVFYRDLSVGQVLGWDVADMAESVTVHAFVRAPYDRYVHDDSRFWNASGASVQLGANGVQLQIESLRALILGGIAFETPNGGKDSPVSGEEHQFPLYTSKEAADSASYTRSVPFLANFTGSVSGLAPGAPVDLRGIKVGEVQSVGLRYDQQLDNIVVPVHFTVEPDRVAQLDLPYGGDLDRMMADLMHRGLRVRMESTSLITGTMQLTIDVAPGSPPGKFVKDGDTYVIPTQEGGGDLVGSAAALVARLNAIPFEQIGQNLNQTLAGASGVVNDPALRQSIDSLRATLASAQTLVANLDHGTAPLMQRLPAIANGLEDAVHRTDKLVGSMQTGYGGDSPFNRDAERLLVQLSDAARSIRVLADLLARHPEALIRGRTDQGSP
ncbi:MAG: MlaD family protein [Acetobacteraceae bacterium]|nr:MlaD family protein [Acetobacteraceae bacterium]